MGRLSLFSEAKEGKKRKIKKRRKVRDFDVPGSTVIAQRAAVPLRFASVKSTHKGLPTPRFSFIGGVREERVVKAIRNVFTNLM